MMPTSTRIRLFFAQLIMMFSFLFFGCYWIRDHHWAQYWYWVDAVIVACLGFLIPIDGKDYKVKVKQTRFFCRFTHGPCDEGFASETDRDMHEETHL
jgi:hypothetical protein